MDEELKARYNKAAFEKMHYHLECHKISTEYYAMLNEEMARIQKMSEGPVPEAIAEVQKEVEENTY